MKAGTLELAEFLQAADRGQAPFVLDVRNHEDYAAWRIETRAPLPSSNVPYFEFLEDPAAATGRVPRGQPLVVVCARGDSSELVAAILAERGFEVSNLAGGMQAYGDHLEAEPVSFATAARFALWQVQRRGKGCLSYVLEAGDEALVVDPSRHVEWYQAFTAAHGTRIVRVLDTHVHADHVSGGPLLAQRAGAVYAAGLAEPQPSFGPRAIQLADGDAFEVGPGQYAVRVEVLATPGHTPLCTSFLIGGRYLLSGDTLFVRGVGRPDLGGRAEEWGRLLHRTLHRRIAALPDSTVVLPGHHASLEECDERGLVRGTLGGLRSSAEFSAHDEEEFLRLVARDNAAPPRCYGDIVRTNLGKLNPDLELISTWELGKNRCAASRP